MVKKCERMAVIALLMVSWPFLAGLVQAQKQSVKVIAANASLHIKPSADSEVISSPAPGDIFEVEAKVGEWYEVRHKTAVGVLITGYIHEKYVEKVGAPTRPQKSVSPGIHFMAKLGGLFSRLSGYDYEFFMPYLDEEMAIYDSVDNRSATGFLLEGGVFFSKNIELTGGVSLYSKSMEGFYAMELPNPNIFNDIAYAEAYADPRRNMTVFDLGVNFHLLSSGLIRPYVGGGASYVMVKMDLLKNLIYDEKFYADQTHSIEITNVEVAEESVNKFGFHVRGGVHFKLGSNFAVFVEGKYLMATTAVSHPLTSAIVKGEKIDIDLGGISSRLGICLFF